MKEYLINEVISVIHQKIGVNVKGCIDPTLGRKGLSFWFDSFSRGGGPVFSVRPSGLKRHIISVRFGPYANTCIEHINSYAAEEGFDCFVAFLDNLSLLYDVQGSGCGQLDVCMVDHGFEIEVIKSVNDQYSEEEIIDTATEVIPKLMGGMADLIGYEVMGGNEEASIEGELVVSISTRRERNPRNRLLCLSIHGEKCKVCGFVQEDKYNLSNNNIIEVHHIEPLSELDMARKYDPATDLVPLCPNCHRAIHSTLPAMTPEKLRKKLI